MAPEEQTFEVARELAFAWAHLIEFTARPTVVEAIQAPPPRRLAAVPGAYSEPEGIEAPPPHTDDDIPY
jgi:hypothetical protein